MPHEWPLPLLRRSVQPLRRTWRRHMIRGEIISKARVMSHLWSAFEESQVAVQPYQGKDSLFTVRWHLPMPGVLPWLDLLFRPASCNSEAGGSERNELVSASRSCISWWRPSAPHTCDSCLVVGYTTIFIGTRLMQLSSARSVSLRLITLLVLPIISHMVRFMCVVASPATYRISSPGVMRFIHSPTQPLF
jgi:hypothetical protein